MQELLANQELLWLLTVVYDLGLAILLYRFFGKYGLYTAVVLGIVLGNLQGGKVSELTLFGYSFTASMGAILYSGIYFATDVLLLDTMIYQFTWVMAGMDMKTAFLIAITKYIFKVFIAGIDTIFIYWVRKW